MRIGIFSRGHCRQTSRLLQTLNQIEANCAGSFSFALSQMGEVFMDGGVLAWDYERVGQLETALVHGFSFSDPVIPDGELDREWTLWQYQHIIGEQQYSFLSSAFTQMRVQGVRVINEPGQLRLAFSRTAMLTRVRDAGFKVPEFVCTNCPDVAEYFGRNHAPVLWRPNTGRAAYQVFGNKQKSHLMGGGNPPVILAECVKGPLIRAYVFAGKPLMLLESGSPDCQGLETMEQVRMIDPGVEIKAMERLSDDLGLVWAQVLYVNDQDGNCWVYDVDPDPHYDWLPEPLFETLNARLARSMLDLHIIADVDPATYQRPTPFLRRMLRILFDMEQSKYQG